MDTSKPIGSEISSVDFEIYSDIEIRKISCKRISNPNVFDNLGHPLSSGLYDLALGAFLKNLCTTCGLNETHCPGHMGHIELPVPVFNPLFFNQLFTLIKATCLHCYNFKLNLLEVHKYNCKLILCKYGVIFENSDLEYSCDKKIVSEIMEEKNESDLLDKKTKQEIIKKRNIFVVESIKKAINQKLTGPELYNNLKICEERQNIINQFYHSLLSKTKCDNCNKYSPLFRKDGTIKIFEHPLTDKQISHNNIISNKKDDTCNSTSIEIGLQNDSELDKKKNKSGRFVLTSELKIILKKLFKNEQSVLQNVFLSRPDIKKKVSSEIFFKQTLLVPSTKFRLPSKVDEELHENPQNVLFSNILKTCFIIKDLNNQSITVQNKDVFSDEKKIIFKKLINSFIALQNDINLFYDSSKNQNYSNKTSNPGIKQILEKKEGLFRKNMMGKRVNYAARSVISPDPMIESNEIGIPYIFATKLTYPEPVTFYNVSELRKNVINGPDKWPGATQIQNDDDTFTSLVGMSLEKRKAQADQLLTPSNNNTLVNKKVYRHISNNDFVLMNRQPTLHKPSMMGHKVKILEEEKTLRLHYSNTTAYNADFDGDEMNLHFPQNENARSEAINLSGTEFQYLNPSSGKPLRGLIQDHISASIWLTNINTFFDRETYQQIIYSCIKPKNLYNNNTRIITLAPTILKPNFLWTGKQVISTILCNIIPNNFLGLNLESQNNISTESWGDEICEHEIIFKDGQHLCGVLDKSQFGASNFGLIHSIYEIYGPKVSNNAISIFGRLFTNYIMMNGFTCGMDDLKLTVNGKQTRTELLRLSNDLGKKAITEATNLDSSIDDNDPNLILRMAEILRDDNKLFILDTVAQTKVNKLTSTIVSKLIPSGSLKKFPHNSMQAMAISGAKGSIVNVSQIMCLLGQQALEGRRVPLMISGKTLPCFKPFETNVNAGGYIKGCFYSGINPYEYFFHCMAGREGLIDTAVKTSRSGYLQRCLAKKLEGIHIGYDNTVRESDGSMIQFLYGGDSIDILKESYLTNFKFCAQNYQNLLHKYDFGELLYKLDLKKAYHFSKKVQRELLKQEKLPVHERKYKYNPVVSEFNPTNHLGSVSEFFQQKLDDFIKTNSNLFTDDTDEKQLNQISKKKFKALMHLKYMMSLIDPGESVGIIASQSIGEPSTQMTLNTFHFAGHGASNVTLGIPRMREIVMTASSKIKTPQMYLKIHDDVSDDQINEFCKSVNRILLSELIDYVTVVENLECLKDAFNLRSYDIQLNFHDSKDYESEYNLPKELLKKVIVETFLISLETVILQEIKKQKKIIDLIFVNNHKTPENNDVEMEVSDNENLEFGSKITDSESSSNESDVDSDAEKKKQNSINSSYHDLSEPDDLPDEIIKSNKSLQEKIIESHNLITKFNFDEKDGKYCKFRLEIKEKDTFKLLMTNIIENLSSKIVVREVPNIFRCNFLPSTTSQERMLITEGVNFEKFRCEDDFIDVNSITSNDIFSILKSYGVEAARNTIIIELKKIFDTYGISISRRHLELVSDVMTRDGGYQAFNRQGIESSTSSFVKMSYETTFKFLTKCVLNREREYLQSPSGNIVLGKLIKSGTGLFEIFAQIKKN